MNYAESSINQLSERFATDLRSLGADRLTEIHRANEDPAVRQYFDALLPDHPMTYSPHLPHALLLGYSVRHEDQFPEVEYWSSTVDVQNILKFGYQFTGIPAWESSEPGNDTRMKEAIDDPLSDYWMSAAGRLRKGPDKFMKYIFEQSHEALESFTFDLLKAAYPGLLTRLALMAAGPIDMSYDDRLGRLREDVRYIKDGGKWPKKFPTARDETYVRSVHALWHQANVGHDLGFVTRLADYEYYIINTMIDNIHPPALRMGNDLDVSQYAEAHQQSFHNVRVAVLQSHAALYEILDIDKDAHNKLLNAVPRKLFRKAGMNLDRFINRVNDDVAIVHRRFQEEMATKGDDIQFEVYRAISARKLLDLIDTGQLNLERIATLQLMANAPAFPNLPHAEEVPVQIVEWEIAPPAIGQGGPHPQNVRQEPSGSAPGWDMARKEKMDEYVNMWGGPKGSEFGQGRTARSRIPSLKESEQYYLAILPQRIGNVIIEHAIADNPALGRHAVYVWRAENGIGRFGQVQQNWETVFSQHKPTMRRLGARRMLHRGSLETKVLEYLTRPVEKLGDSRYSY